MAGKKVDWTASALAMVSDIYDYLEDKAGEDMASEYIDEFWNMAIIWMKNQSIFHSVNIQSFKKKGIVVRSFEELMC